MFTYKAMREIAVGKEEDIHRRGAVSWQKIWCTCFLSDLSSIYLDESNGVTLSHALPYTTKQGSAQIYLSFG